MSRRFPSQSKIVPQAGVLGFNLMESSFQFFHRYFVRSPILAYSPLILLEELARIEGVIPGQSKAADVAQLVERRTRNA